MNTKYRLFSTKIKRYFAVHGRHELPWRKTNNPYHIAVSEVMLQQTQVARVIEKYSLFLSEFPTVEALAQAPLGAVIALWSGLGYNRRAKYLHQMAQVVVKKHGGIFPSDLEDLLDLPGIGPYTARAIIAFAYNKPSAFIETNIRTVYIHHFFSEKRLVTDRELMPIIQATVDQKNPRKWYWALMDYGAHLKTIGNKTHRKSTHYTKQSKFQGSRRQIRGNILKILIAGPQSAQQLSALLEKEEVSVQSVLEDLCTEGFIKQSGKRYIME